VNNICVRAYAWGHIGKLAPCYHFPGTSPVKSGCCKSYYATPVKKQSPLLVARREVVGHPC
jgi:hypothetical protein